MRIDLIRPRDLSADQAQTWRALQTGALESPFLSPRWAQAVERAQPHRRIGIAVFSDDAGAEHGYFTARIGQATAMPAGAPMCDYQAVVGDAALRIEPRALLTALGVDRLDLFHVPADQAAFAPFARQHEAAHLVEMGAGFDAYAAERRAAGVGLLKDVAKKARKAERELGEARFTHASRSRSDLARLIAWKRAQYRATGQTDIFDTPWTLALLDELFDTIDPDFGARLFTLHFGDKLVAAHLHLCLGATVHGWLIAHDPAFERYSPGVMLFTEILSWMPGAGYARLDLGGGDYRFKRELANARQPVFHGFVARPSAAGFLRHAAFEVARVAEALPLGAASALPAKAMRRMDRWRGLR